MNGNDDPRSPAENAQLALLLEVAAAPKPGNVDRHRDLPDLRFEHFLAGAVGASRGFRLAERGASVGEAFETAVHGMSQQSGGNTQFGCLLLLVPLVTAAANGDGPLTRENAMAVARDTTVADAACFYRAFEHVDVAVDDPPSDVGELDVRLGADAIPTLESRELTLFEVMELSAPRDANAREWVDGFPTVFDAAAQLRTADGAVPERVSSVFLTLLAAEEDTLVAVQHGDDVAREVSERAAELHNENAAVDDIVAFADDLVDRGINPGTTADLTAAAIFVALERGLQV